MDTEEEKNMILNAHNNECPFCGLTKVNEITLENAQNGRIIVTCGYCRNKFKIELERR